MKTAKVVHRDIFGVIVRYTSEGGRRVVPKGSEEIGNLLAMDKNSKYTNWHK
jgi:hypothetical protein